MSRSEIGPDVQVPVLVGTTSTRTATLARRLFTTLSRTTIFGGFAAALMPVGMTWPWLSALCGVVLVAVFAGGLRYDVRSVRQLGVAMAPEQRLFLRGPWVTRTHDLADVVAVQVWCDCAASRRLAAPHRDGMEVLLRGGDSVRVEPDTAFPANIAVTLSESLAPYGIRTVDWGETGATVA